MSSRRLKRIANEIQELNNSTEILSNSGIHIYYDDTDMTKIYAMLVGPEKTPYEKGFYFFEFKYPENYPMSPPLAKYLTQGILKNPLNNSIYNVRFNPNLYIDGKVCLSMLNTWAGPGWVPTNTMTNVLVAIQALVLNEYPLQNEPGFENAEKGVLNKYNDIIEYANIRISVIGMINNPPVKCEHFKNIMIDIFLKNIDYYRNFVLTKHGEKMNALIDSPTYSMKIKLDYDKLIEQIDLLYEKINK